MKNRTLLKMKNKIITSVFSIMFGNKVEVSSEQDNIVHKARVSSTTWPDGNVFRHPTGSQKEVRTCVSDWNRVRVYNHI